MLEAEIIKQHNFLVIIELDVQVHLQNLRMRRYGEKYIMRRGLSIGVIKDVLLKSVVRNLWLLHTMENVIAQIVHVPVVVQINFY